MDRDNILNVINANMKEYCVSMIVRITGIVISVKYETTKNFENDMGLLFNKIIVS